MYLTLQIKINDNNVHNKIGDNTTFMKKHFCSSTFSFCDRNILITVNECHELIYKDIQLLINDLLNKKIRTKYWLKIWHENVALENNASALVVILNQFTASGRITGE